MAMQPLLRLVLGNLGDAVTLGLIDDSAGAASELRDGLQASWSMSSNQEEQVKQFQLAMTNAKNMLDALHRPFRDSEQLTRSVATVMSFGRFAVKFEQAVSAPDESTVLRSLLAAPGASDSDLIEVAEACLKFSEDFGVIGAFRQVEAKRLGLDARWPTWTAPPPDHSAPSTAQYWRDRLGLIHIKHKPSPTAADALVRVEFEVRLTANELAREDWKRTVNDDPSGLWLIRPTIVHEGNQRFVQRHAGDGSAQRADCFHGLTRDLASDNFAGGEEERLLVCGVDATLRFRALTLLEGLSGDDPGRDNSDERFVNAVATERQWTNA